jgi:hypothetical protein
MLFLEVHYIFQDNAGLFVDQSGKSTFSGGISWSDVPSLVVLNPPYVLAWLPRSIEVSFSCFIGVYYSFILTLWARNSRQINVMDNRIPDQGFNNLFDYVRNEIPLWFLKQSASLLKK